MENKKELVSIIGRAITTLFLVLVVSALLSSCSESETSEIKEVESSRCVPASAAQLERINVGVKDIEAGNSIKTGWAVRSNDFEKVWFVAAKIYGTSIENGTGPGLWAISGEMDNPGMTLSVDGFAKSFSSWPDASTTDARITTSDDGAQEALSCASKD